MTTTELALEHDGIAQALARIFFWPGADLDDRIQEARISLWKAARTWDPEGGRTFRSYAYTVVKRRLMDLAFTRTEGKRQVRVPRESCVELHEWQHPRAPSTEDVVLERERLRTIIDAAGGLTELERCALGRVIRGEPITVFATGSKSLDNAYQRAKRRLRAAA